WPLPWYAYGLATAKAFRGEPEIARGGYHALLHVPVDVHGYRSPSYAQQAPGSPRRTAQGRPGLRRQGAPVLLHRRRVRRPGHRRIPRQRELRRLPADPHGIGRQPRPDDHDPALARGRPERDAEGEGDANRLSAPRRLRGRRHRGRRLTPPDPPSREFNISGRPTIARTPRGGAGARAGAIRRPGRVDAVNPTSVEVLRRKIGRYF